LQLAKTIIVVQYSKINTRSVTMLNGKSSSKLNVECDDETVASLTAHLEDSSESSQSGGRKMSPLVTTDYMSDVSMPSLGSARGIDSNTNQLVYSSSQTPHGFTVVTKRKSAKKTTSSNSVFNFEELDLAVLPEAGESAVSTARSVSVDSNRATFTDLSSSEDSPEPIYRRIVKTKPRSRRSISETLPLLTNDYVLVEDDFRAELNSNNFEGLTLDTEDIEWSVAEEDCLSGEPLHSPTPRNPRKKQDFSELDPIANQDVSFGNNNDNEDEGAEVDSEDDVNDETDGMGNDQRDGGDIQLMINNEDLSAGIESPDLEGLDDFVLEDIRDIHIQNLLKQQQQYQRFPGSGSSSANTFPTLYFESYHQSAQVALPSISSFEASRTILSNLQFPPSLSAQTVGLDDNSPSPMALTISNTALPLAAALHDIAPYRDLMLQQRPILSAATSTATTATSSNNIPQHHLCSANTATLQTTSSAGTHKKPHSVSKAALKGSLRGKPHATVAEEDFDIAIGKPPKPPNHSSSDSSVASSAANRASKSLAEISRRFVTMYGKDNTMDYISGLLNPDDITG
jgi:hypothetical protein